MGKETAENNRMGTQALFWRLQWDGGVQLLGGSEAFPGVALHQAALWHSAWIGLGSVVSFCECDGES